MIGTYLRIFRKAAGRQTIEMAELLGCSASYYSQVENGRRTPSKKMLHAWAERLGISAGAVELLDLEAPREFKERDAARFGKIKEALVGRLVIKFVNSNKEAQIGN